jgi:predicted lipoprotein with Yx(FWY)xxD motif
MASGTKLSPRWIVGLAGAVAVLLLTAACGRSSGTTSTGVGAGGAPSAPGTTSAGASIKVASTALGSILTTAGGKTIYMSAADKDGKSNCTGTCLQYWPIVPAPASIALPVGVSATLGVLDRGDGSKQLTINGMPAYTFAGDNAAGATTGQGKNTSGGLWWALSPGGSVIKAAAGSASASPTKSKSGGGYGY